MMSRQRAIRNPDIRGVDAILVGVYVYMTWSSTIQADLQQRHVDRAGEVRVLDDVGKNNVTLAMDMGYMCNKVVVSEARIWV